MTEYSIINLLVEKEFADEISRKQIAEIAFRRADAKFRAMVKCNVIGEGVLASPTNEKLSDLLKGNGHIDKELHLTRQGIDRLLNEIKGVNTSISSLRQFEDMSIQVDGLYKMSKTVMSISYLNTGISLANMAVSIAGFIAIDKKITQLSNELCILSNKLAQALEMQRINLEGEYIGIIQRYKSIAVRLKKGRSVDLDKMETLIQDIYTYLYKVSRNMFVETLDTGIALTMIYTLLPLFSVLVNEFTKQFYFIESELPGEYDLWMGLYDTLSTEDYLLHLQDYYFLEKKQTSLAVLDIVNAHLLLALNAKQNTEDQVKMLKALANKERFEEFDTVLTDFAKQRLELYANSL